MTRLEPAVPSRNAVLSTLALLYIAQGIPFGLAVEYLPVVLRQAHYSRAQIAAVLWLQLPWHLKVVWARIGDAPAVRVRSREILLAIQVLLAACVAAYAPFDVRTSAGVWFALTALCALIAATQDVFVDALAVRSLRPADRGFGNIAQVAGYRLGMLAGGAGLLLVVESWGQPRTLLACAAVVVGAGIGAFALRAAPCQPVTADLGAYRTRVAAEAPVTPALGLRAMLGHVFARETWPIIALAATFKLGPHIASSLIKPMLVDAHWSSREVGWAAVTVGTTFALIGAAVGGWIYRVLRDRRALWLAAALQALACAPLAVASIAGVPRLLTTVAIAIEHLASGLGTTILFAALMTATRPSSAALHYTVLTSSNAAALGLGGLAGGMLADRIGESNAYFIAIFASLLPILLLTRWDPASRASAEEPDASNEAH